MSNYFVVVLVLGVQAGEVDLPQRVFPIADDITPPPPPPPRALRARQTRPRANNPPNPQPRTGRARRAAPRQTAPSNQLVLQRQGRGPAPPRSNRRAPLARQPALPANERGATLVARRRGPVRGQGRQQLPGSNSQARSAHAQFQAMQAARAALARRAGGASRLCTCSLRPGDPRKPPACICKFLEHELHVGARMPKFTLSVRRDVFYIICAIFHNPSESYNQWKDAILHHFVCEGDRDYGRASNLVSSLLGRFHRSVYNNRLLNLRPGESWEIYDRKFFMSNSMVKRANFVAVRGEILNSPGRTLINPSDIDRTSVYDTEDDFYNDAHWNEEGYHGGNYHDDNNDHDDEYGHDDEYDDYGYGHDDESGGGGEDGNGEEEEDVIDGAGNEENEEHQGLEEHVEESEGNYHNNDEGDKTELESLSGVSRSIPIGFSGQAVPYLPQSSGAANPESGPILPRTDGDINRNTYGEERQFLRPEHYHHHRYHGHYGNPVGNSGTGYSYPENRSVASGITSASANITAPAPVVVDFLNRWAPTVSRQRGEIKISRHGSATIKFGESPPRRPN
ncbi:hypothetical protein TWF730_007305 [Orbilia blumenaviensis]|uniref:Uncharacterized protein n=1 Tax=Orbilia blumenaviensis TaxID=1796055 RepID=A0AAV9V9Q0_9PEZI